MKPLFEAAPDPAARPVLAVGERLPPDWPATAIRQYADAAVAHDPATDRAYFLNLAHDVTGLVPAEVELIDWDWHDNKLFVNGIARACVRGTLPWPAGQWLLLQADGARAVPGDFGRINGFWTGPSSADPDAFLLVERAGRCGWLTDELDWAVPPLYDEVSGFSDEAWFGPRQLVVRTHDRYGLLDADTLRPLLPCLYARVEERSDHSLDLPWCWVGYHPGGTRADLLVVGERAAYRRRSGAAEARTQRVWLYDYPPKHHARLGVWLVPLPFGTLHEIDTLRATADGWQGFLIDGDAQWWCLTLAGPDAHLAPPPAKLPPAGPRRKR